MLAQAKSDSEVRKTLLAKLPQGQREAAFPGKL